MSGTWPHDLLAVFGGLMLVIGTTWALCDAATAARRRRRRR
jgi:hypothetical protein